MLFVAWLGWVFDSMDATIYALVLHPALHELLHTPGGAPVTTDTIGWYGGIIFSIFLIGWAVGGVLFGVLANRFGRTRTLVFTILIYAVFTGLAALSATWWQPALFRFLTVLGIGGEWVAGAALVAEVWPEEKRAKVVGIAPAVVALLVRLWVKEPERWVQAQAAEREAGPIRSLKLAELFEPGLARSTLVEDDDSYWGEIPGFQGVWAKHETLLRCRCKLREALSDWIALRLRLGREIPQVGRLNPHRIGIVAHAQLPPVSRRKFTQRLRELGFEGPCAGGKHPQMKREALMFIIFNEHEGDLGPGFLHRLLRQAGVSREEWLEK